MLSAGFPAPPARGIDLPGPLFLGFYTVVIMLGIALAVLITIRLWKSRGGTSDDVINTMIWAVLLGILGARTYHVISSPDAYFGADGDFLLAFQPWRGGLSIIGAVALGAVGVWIACRRYGMKFGALTDAIVPGVLLAQAIGRWGNWFNQELYGSETDLPWGLEVDAASRPAGASPDALFHPTFLYESIWNVIGFIALILLFRRFQFKQGMLTWTYVAYYFLGRFWVESLRIDEPDKSTQYPLQDLIGLDWRLNQIVAFLVFVFAVLMLLRLFARRPLQGEDLAEEREIYRVDSEQRKLASEAALEEDGDVENLEDTSSVSHSETDRGESSPRAET